MKKSWLMALFAAMTLHMIYVVTATSLQSNLFADWNALAKIPWMVATVKDFYQTQTPVILWMFYKEESWLFGILWAIAFIALGSIATSFYIVLQLWKLEPGEPLEKVLVR